MRTVCLVCKYIIHNLRGIDLEGVQGIDDCNTVVFQIASWIRELNPFACSLKLWCPVASRMLARWASSTLSIALAGVRKAGWFKYQFYIMLRASFLPKMLSSSDGLWWVPTRPVYALGSPLPRLVTFGARDPPPPVQLKKEMRLKFSSKVGWDCSLMTRKICSIAVRPGESHLFGRLINGSKFTFGVHKRWILCGVVVGPWQFQKCT